MSRALSDLQHGGSRCLYLAGDHRALQLWLLRLLISILMVMGSRTNDKDGGSEGACLLWTLDAHG